ncbi:MAG: selenium-dependent xanthine dehydrogenase [Bacteroidetes bacterium]|nr:selenium-dependent xanthine dehydrogenase [Bacteroidota bacterium]MBU1115571.1 selenium-dependent xanthine dehydrogenase [Bacteroidota bacterium]MBU1799647.1 selenium-dependent xanthine dehydrogenase [Bacteroidota bacterium]
MKFVLNGIEKEYNGDLDLSLLKYLRNIEGITTVKDGCSGQASCGSCTVNLNGEAVLSCTTTMKKVENLDVVTTDGLGEYKQKVFANAFVEKGGTQCGFCTPGIVMRANALIQRNAKPTREQIVNSLTPHLCRCTGYKKVIDSIEYAAESIRDESDIPTPKQIGKVGARQPKYDADKLTLGTAPYVDDLRFEGMLFGALKFSKYPRAKILAIDFTEAEKLCGVKRIITAKDIPGERITGMIVKDWPMMVAIGEITRYVGDVIASVVAESDDIARAALELIKIDYEILEPLTDMKKALSDDAPQIHSKGNLLSETVVDRGNIELAKRKSKYISSGIFETQMIEHAFMETEAAIGRPLNNGVEVYSQGQGVYEDRKQIAKILNLDGSNVRVQLVPNGGGFGGKEDLTVQHHAALASYLLNETVKFALTRDESIIMHPKRHPLILDYTVGCDENGMLTFLEANIIGDTGAYASVGMKVLERAAGHSTGAYTIPNVKVSAKAVYTNNLPCGAMRGFGANQATFAIEGCVDDLCVQGNFDKWQFRFNNAIKNGDQTATGQTIRAGAGVRETLLAVKEIFQNAKYAGIACGIKNTGIGNGMPDDGVIKIEVISENKVILNHGWTEMGQGVNTVAVQFLCEETGIDPNIVEVTVDTAKEARSGMTTASRATSLIGNSIRETSKDFKNDLMTKTLAELAGKVYIGEWTCDWTTKPGDNSKEVVTHYSYSYATQVVILGEDGKIEKIVAAHDAGKIVNPTLFEGQIEGSVHMGLGYAISEELELEKGIPKSTKLRKMGILRAKETPEIEVIGVEVADPHGPHGAKGVGEIGLVATAGAVANAFFKYDGTRYYKLPIKNRKKI